MEDLSRIAREEYDTHPRACHSHGPLGLLAFLLLLMVGCTPPDRPSRLPGPLPDGLEAGLGLQVVRILSPGPDLAYYGLRSEEGPWVVHLLRVNLRDCDLGFRVVRAPKQEDLAGGRSRVTELTDPQGSLILAAVNGDFFTPEGLSVGT